MGNGKATRWPEFEEYVPAIHIPTMEEFNQLNQINLTPMNEGDKKQRQYVKLAHHDQHQGMIQLGYGFGESYVIICNSVTNGKKIYGPKSIALLRLKEMMEKVHG